MPKKVKEPTRMEKANKASEELMANLKTLNPNNVVFGTTLVSLPQRILRDYLRYAYSRGEQDMKTLIHNAMNKL